MKNMSFLVILFVLCASVGYSQGAKQKIKVKIITWNQSMNSLDFPAEVNIAIEKQGNSIKLLFSRTDSTNSTALLDDPELSSLMERANPNTVIEGMERLTRKHSAVFYIDSLMSISDVSYVRFIETFLDTDPKKVEGLGPNLDAKSPGFRPVMVMIYTFTDGVAKNQFSVLSPTEASHPEVYNLIVRSLQLYRKDHPNSFLDKKYVTY